MTTPRHGTREGYRRHLANGTEPCEPCRDANAKASRDLRQAGARNEPDIAMTRTELLKARGWA